MTKYTIKSTSSEGIYYLVNHWQKHKTYWSTIAEMKISMYFNKPADARRSLSKLLKVMDDYRNDVFELVEIKI